MLFFKKPPRAISKMSTGAMCFWFIPKRPEGVLPVFVLCVPSWSPVGICLGTEGWLKSHILCLDTRYGDSSSSLCLNLQ